MENKTKEAVETLCAALKEDKDYYYSWQANIAMAFYDEYFKLYSIEAFSSKELKEITGIANKAADNFLKLLINGK